MSLREFLHRFSLRPVHYLFAAVLLVRLVVLARLTSSPFLLPSGGDMHFYDGWAQRILHGERGITTAFYGLPGYAYLLAFIYKLVGYGPFVPALLQAALDAGTAVLIFKLTNKISLGRSALRSTMTFPRGLATQERDFAGWAAALAWAFFVPAQAYSIILMPSAWAVFAFWYVVWRIVRNDRAPTLFESLFLGLVIGLTANAVATVLFLIPLVAAAAVRSAGKIDNRIAAIVLVSLGAIAGTSPCWIHNYFIARDPVVLSAHSGINFWIGNNPESNGYPKFPPGLRAGQAAMLEDSIVAAESVAGHPLKRAEVSAIWSRRAWDYIAQQPLDWLGLLARKFRNFWSAFQYDDLSIVTTLRRARVIFPGIYFGLVAALAIPGMLLAWPIRAARWIGAAILLHLCALMPVFITERYRLPAVPGLCVLAGTGLSIFWEAIAVANIRTMIKYLVVLIAATMFVAWRPHDPSLWALDAYNSGRQALESSNYALAERQLSRARAYVPENAETNFALGNLRMAQHQPAAAVAFYEEVLHIDPHHKGALNNLGLIALEANDPGAARSYFEAALAQDRLNAKTHFLLARTALANGDVSTAEREIAEARKLAPTQPEFVAFEKELAAHRQ